MTDEVRIMCMHIARSTATSNFSVRLHVCIRAGPAMSTFTVYFALTISSSNSLLNYAPLLQRQSDESLETFKSRHVVKHGDESETVTFHPESQVESDSPPLSTFVKLGPSKHRYTLIKDEL